MAMLEYVYSRGSRGAPWLVELAAGREGTGRCLALVGATIYICVTCTIIIYYYTYIVHIPIKCYTHSGFRLSGSSSAASLLTWSI